MKERTSSTQQEKLVALYEVSAQLGTTLNLEELLRLVMDSVIHLTGAERGFLMLVDNYGELQLRTARNVDSETITKDSMNISFSVVRRAVNAGNPILTDNAAEDPRFADNQSVVGLQLRSIMCTPLWARGRVIGALYVDNRLMAGVFNEGDLELLTTFTNQAAMAIDNARLFEQTDKALARRVEELTLFQRIDRELNKSLDLNRALGLALQWAVQLTDADSGTIGLLETLEDESQALRISVAEGIGASNHVNKIIPETHPILARVIDQGKTIQTPEATLEESISGTESAVQLAVPIKKEGTVIGLITLESHLVTIFMDEDVEFVSRMADRAALAIENARLYEAVQAANAARAKFTSVVTHELRIPLTSIRGYTDLLLKGIAGSVSDQQADLLAIIQRNTQRMSVLISDLSALNQMESGRMKFDLESFDLRDVVTEVAADLRESFSSRQQTFISKLPENKVEVYADRMRVGQVLTNLISNANKYTPNGGEIEVSLKPNGSFARIDVSDNGIGIKEEEKPSLFQQFFRSEDQQVRDQNGWGLGLSIVKMMVESQGGDVDYESVFGQGSTFSFTLPLSLKN